MTTPIFYGHISQGKLILDLPQKYLVHMAGLEGKEIELILRKKRSQRSLEQNRYYWGVVVEILGNYFGYEKEEMHEALKFKFLRIPDRQLETVMSTTKLTTVGFVNYIDKIVRWAAEEYQVYIPDPNQVEY